MIRGVRVPLSDSEWCFVYKTVKQYFLRTKGFPPDAKNFTIGNSLKNKFIGGLGEFALSKFTGIPWRRMRISTRFLGDVGRLEVKTRPRPEWNLCLPLRENLDRVTVLCLLTENSRTGRFHRWVDLAGWYNGLWVKEEWIWNPHGKLPCYKIPNEELKPIHTLFDQT